MTVFLFLGFIASIVSILLPVETAGQDLASATGSPGKLPEAGKPGTGKSLANEGLVDMMEENEREQQQSEQKFWKIPRRKRFKTLPRWYKEMASYLTIQTVVILL